MLVSVHKIEEIDNDPRSLLIAQFVRTLLLLLSQQGYDTLSEKRYVNFCNNCGLAV